MTAESDRALEELEQEREDTIERVFALQTRLRKLKREIAEAKAAAILALKEADRG